MFQASAHGPPVAGIPVTTPIPLGPHTTTPFCPGVGQMRSQHAPAPFGPPLTFDLPRFAYRTFAGTIRFAVTILETPLKDAALMVFFALAFTFGMMYLAQVNQPSKPQPVECSAKLLACDPDFYASVPAVRVRTEGFEVTGERELSWRRDTGSQPAVVVQTKNRLPSPLPPHLTGTCHGRIGGVVLVECP